MYVNTTRTEVTSSCEIIQVMKFETETSWSEQVFPVIDTNFILILKLIMIFVLVH